MQGMWSHPQSWKISHQAFLGKNFQHLGKILQVHSQVFILPSTAKALLILFCRSFLPLMEKQTLLLSGLFASDGAIDGVFESTGIIWQFQQPSSNLGQLKYFTQVSGKIRNISIKSIWVPSNCFKYIWANAKSFIQIQVKLKTFT